MLSSGLDSDKASLFASSIYTEYASFIRNVIRHHLKDNCQADDIYQDFFLDLLVQPVPNDIEHIESYLYGALVNCIAENARSTKCYRMHLCRYAQVAAINEAVNAPEITMINTEETSKIFMLIQQQLSHKEFLAITLRCSDNLRIHEIASVMDVEIKTVRQYLRRGYKKLRSLFNSPEVFAASGYGLGTD